ncbi:MAG: ABC transporter substrate-binding protein [Gemmatimonadales bacterium]
MTERARCTGRDLLGRLAGAGAVIATLLGCEQRPTSAVIAVAFNLTDSTVLQVVKDELATGTQSGDVQLSVVFDRELPGEPPDAAVARAERLGAIDGLVGVAGHGDSRSSLAAAAVYNTARIPQVVPIATNRLLAQAGAWTFMLAPNDSLEGHFIASFLARSLGARRVTLFYQNNDYGVGLREGVRAGLPQFGLQLLTEVGFDRTSDFPTLVAAALRRGRPDALIVAGYSRETIGIARAVHALAPGLRIVAGDGVLAGFGLALADSAGPAVDSLFAVAFWVPTAADSVSQRFVTQFRGIAGRDPAPSEAMLCDAILVFARTVRAVGSDRAAIRDYLRGLGRERPPVRGVTGAIAFAREAPVTLVMARIRRGRVERLRGLLRFVRAHERQVTRLNLNEIARGALDLVSYRFSVDEIQVAETLNPQLPAVLGDAIGLEQVMVNLLSNAIDALRTVPTPRRLLVESWVEEGRVRLSVADTGPGVPAEFAERLFKPFATTKGTRGTGLGLYISRQIVREAGGELALASRPPQGARFVLSLPALAGAPAEAAGLPAPTAVPLVPATPATPSRSSPVPARASAGALAGRRVLLVDDEAPIRQPLARFLARRGAHVLEAVNGLDALDRLKGQPVDLIIADLRMPKMSGVAFYARLQETQPQLAERVLFLSGDISQLAEPGTMPVSRDRVLDKPVRLSDLEHRILQFLANATSC